jgi:hypothetical protein
MKPLAVENTRNSPNQIPVPLFQRAKHLAFKDYLTFWNYSKISKAKADAGLKKPEHGLPG